MVPGLDFLGWQVKGAPGEWGSKYLCLLVRDTGI